MDDFILKSLDIDSQVVEVNKLLLNGDSLVQVAKKFNDTESAIRKRFNRKGYTRPDKYLFKLTNKQSINNKTINLSTNISYDKLIKDLIERIDHLEIRLNELQASSTATNDSTISNLPFINTFDGEAKGRTLKVYDSSIDKLHSLLKLYPSLLK